MAKRSTARTTKGTDVAVRDQGQAPAFLQQQASVSGPRGMSLRAEDSLVPLIYVLQAQSPQVLKQRNEYIKGAVAGDVWLRESIEPVVKGEDGIAFQPCFFQIAYVEWQPNRGGFVARHEAWPTDIQQVPHPQNRDKFINVRKSTGNEVVETRYHSGFVIGGKYGLADLIPDGVVMPYVIPLTSTGHQFSRRWTFQMTSTVIPGTNPPVVADAWHRIYHLVTEPKSNNQGDWFSWKINDADWITSEAENERGLRLYTSFASGAQRAAAKETGNSDDASNVEDQAEAAGI